jgi:hypothetical protein
LTREQGERITEHVSFACEFINLIQGTSTFIHFYRKAQETNPGHLLTQFKNNTGVSNLRKHLYMQHLEEWVGLCRDLGIPITAKAALEAIEDAHGVEREEPEHLKYSGEAFLDSLAELIVGDDLVSCILDLNQLI